MLWGREIGEGRGRFLKKIKKIFDKGAKKVLYMKLSPLNRWAQ